jgi:hypothetical protein
MNKWTADEKQFVKDNYQRMSADDIGQHLGRTGQAIRIWCKEHGVVKQKRYTDSDKAFIQANYQIMSAKEIADHIGTTPQGIHVWCSKHGLLSKDNGIKDYRTYKSNKEYFSDPNVENSYYAGLIAADGCVGDNGHVMISLQESDRTVLEAFAQAINYDGPIACKKNGVSKSGETLFATKIDISNNRQWEKDLKKHWNITPRKSITLQPPNLKDKKLIRSFIVGYIDGDGCIMRDKSRNRLILTIAGTQDLLKWIKKQFDKWCPAEGAGNEVRKYRQTSQVCRLTLTGKRAERICKELMITSVPYMERKWVKVINK